MANGGPVTVPRIGALNVRSVGSAMALLAVIAGCTTLDGASGLPAPGADSISGATPGAQRVDRSKPPEVVESPEGFSVRRLSGPPSIDGRTWIAIQNYSNPKPLRAPNGQFTLTLEEASTNDVVRYRLYFTEGGGARVQLDPGRAVYAFITRDSRWIISDPLEVIDVRNWRRYSLSKLFNIDSYVILRAFSADGQRLFISHQPCPFDCKDVPSDYYEIGFPPSAVVGSAPVGAQSGPQMSARQDHLAWVADLLERMQSIKPGATLEQVFEVFAMHSGQQSLFERTVIGRDCPYFVADVQFEHASPPSPTRDAADPWALNWREGRLIKISKPYVDPRWGAHPNLDVIAPPPPRPDYVAWVGEVLASMETIKPGMTRGDLVKVFTTEGGLSQPLERTFVSRECPYFKVHVTFRAVGRPSRRNNGQDVYVEDAKDVIVTISKPFLEFAVAD